MYNMSVDIYGRRRLRAPVQFAIILVIPYPVFSAQSILYALGLRAKELLIRVR
jgi:hypothetical protein